jgi:hypothetical protein
LVFLKIQKSVDNSLLNRVLWFPSECSDLPAVKENEGVIAGPAPLSSGVMNAGPEPEMCAYPVYRIVYFTVFISTKIENVDFFLGFLNCTEHRIDAVLYIKIRFFLVPVPENIQPVRVVAQLVIEIKDMPMGIAFPKN